MFQFIRRHKNLFILLLVFLLATTVYAADTLLRNMAAADAAANDDIFYLVNDPNGVPANFHIGFEEFTLSITKLGTVATGVWNADFQADIVKDTDIDWGAGAGQVDLADIPGGTAGADTFNFSAATVTLPSRQANSDKHYTFNLFNPNALYADDTQICVDPKTDAALTITNIEVTCDADPATELDFNLKFADAFIGLGNATLIVAMDTANGAASIAAGFNDPTVPSGKCVYVEFDAEPDSAITQVSIKVKWDYD